MYSSSEELLSMFEGMTKKEKDEVRALLFLEMLVAANDKERLKFIAEASKLLAESRKKK